MQGQGGAGKSGAGRRKADLEDQLRAHFNKAAGEQPSDSAEASMRQSMPFLSQSDRDWTERDWRDPNLINDFARGETGSSLERNASRNQFGSSQPQGDELMDELINSLFTEGGPGGPNPFAPSEQLQGHPAHTHACALDTGSKLSPQTIRDGCRDSGSSSPGDSSSSDSKLSARELLQLGELGDSLLEDV